MPAIHAFIPVSLNGNVVPVRPFRIMGGTGDLDEVRQQAFQRLEILDAFVVAIDRRDELMQIVGAAASADDACVQLGARFAFNETQAVAVLDLQIRRFAIEQRRSITDERRQIRASIGST